MWTAFDYYTYLEEIKHMDSFNNKYLLRAGYRPGPILCEN